MSYKAYADESYYNDVYGGTVFDDHDQTVKYLKQASRHIDSVTFNRINSEGFEKLTLFQQEVIQEVCCMQAEFEYENQDELESIFSGYGINGVSAQIGNSWNIFMEKGVAMKRDTYALLCQTGLCCRIAR